MVVVLLRLLLLRAAIPSTIARPNPTGTHSAASCTASASWLSAVQVDQFVLLEVRALGERLHAYVAVKWFLPCMGPLVLRQVVLLREDTVAEDTVEWLDAAVHILVRVEVRLLGKGLVANVTFKWTLPGMSSGVVVKAVTLRKNLCAKRTIKMFPCLRS